MSPSDLRPKGCGRERVRPGSQCGVRCRSSVVDRCAPRRVRRRRWARAADRRRHSEVRAGLDRVPAFDLPHRRYYLVVGFALDVARVCEPGTGRPQVPHVPDL